MGMMYNQSDMPYTKNGLRPDIIMNPHAIPSRMTIGQLIETLLGKLCVAKRCYGDGTPFSDLNITEITDALLEHGIEPAGDEILYNPKTGEQLPCKIFFGPTYYQRLKHIVKDKVHCLSMDHEVLTRNGWKFHEQLNMDDEIATLEDNIMVYKKPTNIFHYPDYKGKMYHIKTQSIDLNVTDGHRMWVAKPDPHKENGWLKYEFEFAKDIIGQTRMYKTAVNFCQHDIPVHNSLNKNNVIEEKLYDYEGPVFCVEVPSGVFMVRRNGKSCWTGNSRSNSGPIVLLTRQPAEGRSREGGLRLGEMEVQCNIAHGCFGFLKERLMECSDNYCVHICGKCGMISNVNPSKNKFECNSCMNNINFREIRIPYAYKLLTQEIQSMGIATRFKT
jgi:hypothetical protein